MLVIININVPLAKANFFSGQADNALDKILGSVARILKHYYVAALGRRAMVA